ncbi:MULTISPECIES: type II secretion system protein [unclassified Undibacterium]|uniref:type II secretion system protein n=1 Tax=unclassified Undibacterium TaxID=2630295 RepID=UPI002AC9BAB0|nr:MULTISPECIES: type IV pilin protein [unclassified Undibacterium]MEB0141215.1 type IV pilin protein [Undibacterium sp. CCC2.1]MEB0174286.1 type IV pilin protein [Undibacterium sp. CCC1.1]MEB0178218.1 type IV pilin protein [Undibacterium sp. CCC3.4]MEB0217422.1 type IV pilin protein [Undibacterium sp. 5I2]WPX42120.1 type IV pilin protein [Undibacterium sp. CCC3.4]
MPSYVVLPESGRLGWTLLELVFCLCILAVLTVYAMSAYHEHIVAVKRHEGKVALLKLMQQQENYFTAQQAYQTWAEAPAPSPFIWYSGLSAARSAYQLQAQACAGEAATRCIELHAVPGAKSVDQHFSDPVCGQLLLDSRGKHSYSGHGSRQQCW